MSPVALIILIIVIVVILAAIAFGVQASRRRRLQKTFGPEYDRVVADTGSRADAEKELRERERRHADLELKPLSPESQRRYSAAWQEVQIQFVDNPEQAVSTADDLVTRLIAERGYPTADYDDQLANLSVEHARTLGHYRDAHEISLRNQRGEASTEDLRQALVHYRALFADLLGTEPVRTDAAADTDRDSDRVGAHRMDTDGNDLDRADTDRDRLDRADTDRDRFDRADTDGDRLDRSDSDRDRFDRADTDRDRFDRADTDRDRFDRADTDRDRFDRADTDRTDDDRVRTDADRLDTDRADDGSAPRATDERTDTTASDTDVARTRPDATNR